MDVNDALCESLGYSREELAGMTWAELTHPDDLAADAAQFNRVLKGEIDGYAMDKRFIHKDGHIVFTRLAVRCVRKEDGNVDYFVALVENITERKLAEERLRDGEERLRMALDAAHMGIFDWSIQDNRIVWSRWHEEFWGYKPGEFGGNYESFASRVHPDDLPAVNAEVSRCMASHEPFAREFRVVWLDGSAHWIGVVGEFVYGGDGRPVRMRGVAQEITGRKRMEEALKTNEKRLNLAAESGEIGLWEMDIINHTTWRSLRHDMIFGYDTPLSEWTYEMFLEHVVADDRDYVSQKFHDAIAKTIPWDFECRIRRKDGEIRWIWAKGNYEYNALNEKIKILGAVQDITERRKDEEQIRLAASVFNCSGEAIIIAGANGRIIVVNPAFTAITGYSQAEVAGQNPRIMKSGLHNGDFYRDMWLQLKRDGVWRGEVLNRRKNGEIFAVWQIISAVRDSKGNVSNYISLFADMSERKQQEAVLATERRRLQDIIDGTYAGAWEWNVQSGETVFNERWAEIIGYSLAELAPTTIETWTRFAHPDDLKISNELLGRHFSRLLPYYECEVRMRHKDGHWVWVLDRGRVSSWTEDGKPLLMSGTHQDISRQKADEAALKEARHLAEAANTAKSMFLATMSHEIRTPMNGIIGLTQLALEQPLSPRVRDYLKKIDDSSGSLLNILNDILDYSKIEAGILSLEARPFNLDAMLEDARNLFSLYAEEKGLEFAITVANDVPRWLVSDELRLRQVVVNLLSNAIKFTERGKVSLEVTFRGMERSKARLRFRVTDTGIGMSQDAIAKLFHPFTQADSSITRRFGGTGLGLAISSRILRLLGSECRVESSPDNGSVFSFELEVDLATAETQPGLRGQPSKQQDTPYPEDFSPVSGALVLVAEDNQINLQIVEEILASRGVRTRKAPNGKEALELAERERFDAVLMDVQMPVMDGLEAARRLRQNPRFVSLPIIALSAGVTEDERKKALGSGMNYFLSKPIDREALFSTLAKCIKPERTVLKTVDARQNSGETRLPTLAGIDLSYLRAFVSGDEGVAGLLLHFNKDAGKTMGLLEDKLLSGDYEEAGRLLHALKGMSGNVGAKELHAAAVSLEREWKSGLYNGAALTALRSAYSVITNSLKKLSGKGEVVDKPSNAAAATDFLPLANRLETLLSGKYFVPDDLLSQLEFTTPIEEQDTFQKIKRHIENIQYGKALDLLKLLTGEVKDGTA